MKNSKNTSNASAFIYILKLWIFTCSFSAIITILIDGSSTRVGNILFLILLNFLYSFPSMIILMFILRLFTTNKVILIPISIILVFASFLVLYSGYNKTLNFIYPTIYSLVISILMLIIDIKRK